jgi:hypothetical protein
MGSNEYRFLTVWQVHATAQEVVDVLSDASDLPRWWPSVYLDARIVEPGDATGVGRMVDLWTKGWLPYTLRWRFRVTHSDPPRGFVLDAEGDFVGRGVWTFTEQTDSDGVTSTRIEYDWRIRAEKDLLRILTPVMRPFFSANHHWAMAQGERSLRLELARRRAAGDQTVLDALPRPPGPTFDLRRRGRTRRA